MRQTVRIKAAAALLGLGAALASASVARADLIAFYTFDNGTVDFGAGTVTDVSGNGRTGTLSGTGGLGGTLPTSAAGFEGQALDFNGTNQFVRLTTVNIDPSASPQLTMGGWFSADDATRLQALISQDNGNFDRSLYVDNRDGTDGAEFEWSAFRASGVVGGPNVGTTPTPYVFVALRHNQATGTFALDVDGVRLTRTGVAYNAGHAFTEIARNPSFNGEIFNGRADNVFFYNNVLTDDEIDAIRLGGATAILGGAAAAPEPGALALLVNGLGMALAGGAVRYRRGRRKVGSVSSRR